uniref:Transmembrane protein n=1 Tax=Elaeophora elaphi TaxID=1147741 RepID=A0A0R3RWP9_9BILA
MVIRKLSIFRIQIFRHIEVAQRSSVSHTIIKSQLTYKLDKLELLPSLLTTQKFHSSPFYFIRRFCLNSKQKYRNQIYYKMARICVQLGMEESDLKPLVATASSPSPVRKELSESIQLDVAQVWPCRCCGMILGICHLLLGIVLLIFDVVTNNISETAFAITASLSFIVCGIFSFISARRLDRPAQLLLLFFSIFSMAMSITMFVDSAALINHNCDRKECHGVINNVHVVLLCSVTVSFATMIVCFRSLRRAYRVRKASSPYSTLIEGHYDAFYIKPRFF